MNPVALITGATDGIGRATAIELARMKYTVHILGRNTAKGEETLNNLKEIYPDGAHEFFFCDLSTTDAVHTFLDGYTQLYQRLDVLVLNAGIFPAKTTLSADGLDLSFSVGYVSRYLFSIRLNKLLTASTPGKVIHVCGSVIGNIQYEKLKKPTYNKIKSVWQTSVGSAFLTYHWKSLTHTNVTHTHWNPGIVNTQTVQSQSFIVRFLSGLMGMIEPNVAGQLLAQHIQQSTTETTYGHFYSNGQPKSPPKQMTDRKKLQDLLTFSESFTQFIISPD